MMEDREYGDKPCTCVDELAFGVKVVKRNKELPQSGLQQLFCKSVNRVSASKVLPAIPHRSLDKAGMVATGMVEREATQG